jgi:DNA repair exonuclease SbcCD ATPase subunit
MKAPMKIGPTTAGLHWIARGDGGITTISVCVAETLSGLQDELIKALEKSKVASKSYEDAQAKLNPLREKAEAAQKEVNGLMAQYARMTGAAEPRKRGRPAGSFSTGIRRPPNPDKPCKVCGFLTEPHHDERKLEARADIRNRSRLRSSKQWG